MPGALQCSEVDASSVGWARGFVLQVSSPQEGERMGELLGVLWASGVRRPPGGGLPTLGQAGAKGVSGPVPLLSVAPAEVLPPPGPRGLLQQA